MKSFVITAVVLALSGPFSSAYADWFRQLPGGQKLVNQNKKAPKNGQNNQKDDGQQNQKNGQQKGGQQKLKSGTQKG